MAAITAVIIDDEPLDRALLQSLVVNYCPQITVLAMAAGVAEGLAKIDEHKPDVVFLDIQMRGETGFDLISQLKGTSRQKIVFTTGYNDYGIQAVKAGAFDYLLKPIDVEELEVLEKKLLKALSSADNLAAITVTQKGVQHFISLHNILYLQAQGSYCKIYVKEAEEYTVSKNLKQVQEEIKDERFVQIHRSVIVNKSCIVSYKNTGNEAVIMINTQVELPVSRKYKTNLQQHLP
jgi:two-component system, LytTR family, response regulator